MKLVMKKKSIFQRELLELVRLQQPLGELEEVDLLEDEHCFLSVTYRCL